VYCVCEKGYNSNSVCVWGKIDSTNYTNKRGFFLGFG
jgi:hypothetical protein